jgi:PAS domain S-box-containing protein
MKQLTETISKAGYTTRLVLFMTLAYALLGAVGLKLAIPPGYASPVFPAAGLALACVLMFKRKGVSGVWLGSVLLNLSHAWLTGKLNPTEAAVAVAVATGATIQAWAGSCLVIRWQGLTWYDMEREQDTFAFLMLGGILPAVLSPTVGVTALYAAGIIEKAEFLFTWWNWYIGDAIGILVFAPLTLCMLNRSNVLWRDRRRRILAPTLLTMLLVWLAFYSTAHWEKQSLESRLQDDGEIIAKRIRDRLVTHREVLSSLSHFVEATPDFSFRQFELFTLITLRDNPDIFALSYNDLVTDDQRPAFERMMTGLSPLGPFQITERDSSSGLVRAAARSEYVTVRYIVPIANNQQAVGYDINSEPIRRAAIEQARRSNSMAVTAPIQLVQEQKKRVGLLALLPVTDSITAGADDSLRLFGFAVAVIKIDETIDIATRYYVPDGLVFQLTDIQAPDGRRMLYRSTVQGADDMISAHPAQWETGLRMGDRDWRLSVYTTAGYQQQHRPWMAWIVGVAGLLFVALLQILMMGMTGRTAVILRKNKEIQNLARTLEMKVDARTAELNESMQSLHQVTARLMLAVQAGGVGIWDYDVINNRLLWDEQMFRLYGVSPDQFCGVYEEWSTDVHPEDRQRFDSEIRLALAGEKDFDTGFRIVQPDGTIRNIRALALVQCDDSGQPLHMIGTNWDVTAHIQAEEGLRQANETLEHRIQKRTRELEILHAQMATQEKMASVGQLAAGIAHELNNPLNFVFLNFVTLSEYFEDIVDVLRAYQKLAAATDNMNPILPESKVVHDKETELHLDFILNDTPELFKESRRGFERIARIVQSMRDFSHVDRTGEFTKFNINTGIEDTLVIARNEYKYIADVTTDLGDLPEIRCLPEQLNQVFLNLIVNSAQAIKSLSRPERGQITIRTWQDETDVFCEIADNGPGVPADIRNRIFEPFFTTKPPGQGTGLGLSICYGIIVEKHQGALSVHCPESGGTIFSIRISKNL